MTQKETTIRANVTLKGDLARAFIEEYAKTIKETDGAVGKSEFARRLFVEALIARGYEVEDTVSWGGYRERQDDEPGQLAGVLAA